MDQFQSLHHLLYSTILLIISKMGSQSHGMNLLINGIHWLISINQINRYTKLYMLCLLTLLGLVHSRAYRFPLEGGQLVKGYYSVTLYVGTPPIQQQYLVDTGSSVTTFPCSTCYNCHETNPSYKYYNPQASKTSHTPRCPSNEYTCDENCKNTRLSYGPCRSTLKYLDTTRYDGHIVKDVLNFNTQQQQNLTTYFQCQDTRKAFHPVLQKSMLGFLGIGPSPSLNVLYMWFQKLGIRKSVCLCLGQRKGYMELGAGDQFWDFERGVQFSYLPNIQAFILNGINQISLGYWRKDRGILNILVDSGSTLSIFPQQIYEGIEQELLWQCNQHKLSCVQIPGEIGEMNIPCFESQLLGSIDDIFEPFKMRQGKNIYQWKASQYLLYVAHFTGFRSSPNIQAIVLGQTFLRNRRTVFDMESHKVIFGPRTTCYHPTIWETVITYVETSRLVWLILACLLIYLTFKGIQQLCNRFCPYKKQKICGCIRGCFLIRCFFSLSDEERTLQNLEGQPRIEMSEREI